jgi:ligand-binding sensor domain-containing protein/signal transduction histidine kinase
MLALCSAGYSADVRAPGAVPLSREYSGRIWRVPDGLPQNRIQAISQTPEGYLWIGTSGGLVRFDGVRFSIFDRANTPAFRDDSILALHPSRDGSLWVGAEGGRLLNYRNGAFTVFGPEQGLTNSFVRALHEDAQGTLWIGTDRGFFRKRAARIERLDGSTGLPVMAVTGMAADATGRIWVVSSIGLVWVENGAPRLVSQDSTLFDGITSIRPARHGGVWALSPNAVRHINGNRATAVPGLGGLSPVTAAEDADGNLWIGTLADGLLRAGPSGVSAYTDPDALPARTVFAIFEDREGNLWVGTSDGLLRLSRTAVHVLDSRDGLADDNISTVYQGRDGAPWIITITGRIFRYRDGRVSEYQLPGSAAAQRFRVVYEDSSGALWLGSGNSGITQISGKEARSFTLADGLRSNMIRQFLEDRHGHIWIGLGSGLSRWDGSRFHNYYLEEGLSYGSVRILVEDRNGDLLVGTDAGLNRVHHGKFVADPAFAATEGERIWSIHQDASGALWVGTRGGGLFRIKNGKAARITVRDGLLSNAIYQVTDDGRGNLWMSGPAGVFFAPQSELDRLADGRPGPVAVVPYGIAEGLQSTQMNGGMGPSGFRSAAGDLWFPSVKGAVRIDPGHIRITRPSQALIESIVADERPLPLEKDIVAPPGHGKLEIHYTAASLRSPERMAFRYKLEEFDSGWNTGSRGRAAYYTNLPPGRYRFRVVATDGGALDQSSEAELSFVLQPHFYQTSWFYAICVSVVALCVWAGLRLYARQTRQRFALLFTERTRLAREMHDTVIQGCAGVSTLLEAAASLQSASPGSGRELLDQARVQARLVLDEARQAVWDLRRTHLEGDIESVLRDFARQISVEKGIPIDVELVGDTPQVDERVLRGILLVAREAIRNSVNHADPRHIRIGVSFGPEEARLEVADDGRGFTPASERSAFEGHYGIVGMRERIEQLGGEFFIASAPGRGTSVIARLPIGGARLRSERLETRS